MAAEPVNVKIGAVVLAAGMSTRMGSPKMVLPWGATTVIGQVVSVLSEAGIGEVVVVTGGARQEVETALSGAPVRFVYNPHFANGEMLDSIQLGIQNLPPGLDAFLFTLGDQPQIEADVIRRIKAAYVEKRPHLVIPSFQMRRGHPWLVDHSLWTEILQLRPPQTLRNFLHLHANEIEYTVVENSSILADLDTPEDYRSHAPEATP